MNEMIVSDGRWTVKSMVLTWPKIDLLWKKVSKINALFSDLTKGDFSNFFNALTSRSTLWFEIWRDDEEIVGMVWMTDTHMLIDGTCHMMFLDSRPAEKKPLVKKLIKWVFANYPFQRITAFVPEQYFGAIRITEGLGFKCEGRKHEAVLIKGRWSNLLMFGITRGRVERMP